MHMNIQCSELALKDIKANDLKNVVIAYEPVWAIGTGKTATADLAEEVCKFIRNLIKDLYSSEVSDSIAILYGGSMNSKNAQELLSQEDIDKAIEAITSNPQLTDEQMLDYAHQADGIEEGNPLLHGDINAPVSVAVKKYLKERNNPNVYQWTNE